MNFQINSSQTTITLVGADAERPINDLLNIMGQINWNILVIRQDSLRMHQIYLMMLFITNQVRPFFKICSQVNAVWVPPNALYGLVGNFWSHCWAYVKLFQGLGTTCIQEFTYSPTYISISVPAKLKDL